MAAALALLPIVLQYLPKVETGVEQLIAWITAVRSAAKQAAVWTPEQETDFLEALIAQNPAWQTDAALAAAAAPANPVAPTPPTA